MFWSLVLLTMKEASEDDTRDSRKKRDTDKNSPLQKNDSDSNAQPEADKNSSVSNTSFKKLWDSNSNWASKAVEDAIHYAKFSTPRQAFQIGPKSEKETPPLTAAFNESVWPVLRSRGWKEENTSNTTKTSKKQTPLKQYIYGSRTVSIIFLKTIVGLW